MAAKEIIWSLRAKQELMDILDFYNERNGNTNYSFKLINELENWLDILSKSEFIGRLTSDKKTRVIVMKAYLIFYEVQEKHIEILSFWDNRQSESKKIINP